MSGWRFFLSMAVLGLGAMLAPASAQTPLAAPTAAAEAAAPDPGPAPTDPCLGGPVVSNPIRPNWNSSTATTLCGILELDSGWQRQPMGGRLSQQPLVTDFRYGITPRLDLRFGLGAWVVQSGGTAEQSSGVGDQWLIGRFRYHDGAGLRPSLSLLYGWKFPTASPSAGLGTGYASQQIGQIASLDQGKNHVDITLIEQLNNASDGTEAGFQAGVALTRPLNSHLSFILESYGGSQPGTADRLGANLGALCYALRPWLLIDGAYTEVYTAGEPRSALTFGFTWAMRPGWPQLPRSARWARLLGR